MDVGNHSPAAEQQSPGQTAGASAGTVVIEVKAGPHRRDHCPVDCLLDLHTVLAAGSGAGWEMRRPDGKPVPLQAVPESDGGVRLHWLVSGLEPGQTAFYSVCRTSDRVSAVTGELRLEEQDGRIAVVGPDGLLAAYAFEGELAKPYIGPVLGPGGVSYTRIDLDTKEHPHHRSVWAGIGDVNGHDFWNEPAGRFGRQHTAAIAERAAGPVFAKLVADLEWRSHSGKAQLVERRTIQVYNTPPGCRLIDLDIELTARHGRVELGATKEAGPLGIRVAESMKADCGGTIVNAYGSIGEKECWGKRSPWCDYYGEAGGQVLGIAAFDHMDNADFPAYWHVRSYGLLAANNLYFAGGRLLQKGETIRYRHRLYFHTGNTQDARVADKYQDYIHPPEVCVTAKH